MSAAFWGDQRKTGEFPAVKDFLQRDVRLLDKTPSEQSASSELLATLFCQEARIRFSKGGYAESLKLLETACTLAPPGSHTANMISIARAQSLWAMGNDEQAVAEIAHLQRGPFLDADAWVSARLVTGQFWLRVEEPQRAFIAYGSALEKAKGSDRISALEGLGRSEHMAKQPLRACRWFKIALTEAEKNLN
jgi:hypothetical protein